MPPHPDAIADCVLKTFRALPSKFKPRHGAPNGRREWVPLAGIVLSRDRVDAQPNNILNDVHFSPLPDSTAPDSTAATTAAPSLTCVALATGMKCLPAAKLPAAKGNVLHDWHAEVLAIRAFNRWLLDECKSLVDGGGLEGRWVRWREEHQGFVRERACGAMDRHTRPAGLDGSDTARSRDGEDNTMGQQHHQPPFFTLHDDVSIHMYCSEAPCGDASMELTMSSQDDATPWPAPAPSAASTPDAMLGRGHFDQLGIVRRKPARPDAPQTYSKSCSDKLALKQCTGLLSSLTALIVEPKNTYLDTLVLPEGQIVREACERAFGPEGRMGALSSQQSSNSDVQEEWGSAGFKFHPVRVLGTSREFEFSRHGDAEAGAAVPSNISAMWTPSRQEVLINGVLQGRKQFDSQGASSASRRRIWEHVCALFEAAGMESDEMRKSSYGQVKEESALLTSRRMVKRDVKAVALKGWKRNHGDDGWCLEQSGK